MDLDEEEVIPRIESKDQSMKRGIWLFIVFFINITVRIHSIETIKTFSSINMITILIFIILEQHSTDVATYRLFKYFMTEQSSLSLSLARFPNEK